jgi:flavodoxin I
MMAIVIYDSVYGNTEKIARAIAEGISVDTRAVRPDEVSPDDMKSIDLIIVGAPTQGGRPTPPIREFLKKIPASVVKGNNVAAFDTRISAKWVGIFGYAAGKIAKSLKKMGGNLLANPEAFFVTGTEGPLKEGEVERAGAWVKQIIAGKK